MTEAQLPTGTVTASSTVGGVGGTVVGEADDDARRQNQQQQQMPTNACSEGTTTGGVPSPPAAPPALASVSASEASSSSSSSASSSSSECCSSSGPSSPTPDVDDEAGSGCGGCSSSSANPGGADRESTRPTDHDGTTTPKTMTAETTTMTTTMTAADPPTPTPVIPIPLHGPSILRTYAMSTTFSSIPAHLTSHAAHPSESRTLGNLNETALHWSCFHRGPAYAVLPIASSYPEATGIVGACGRTPLHIVCAGGGRGTVNGSEETVDIVATLVSYNYNMSCLVSVEDGETPLSGMWGVYERQCRGVLGDVLDRLGVGGEHDEDAVDAEYGTMLRTVLEQRRAQRIRREEEQAERGQRSSSSGAILRPIQQHSVVVAAPAPPPAAPAAPSASSILTAVLPDWAHEIPTHEEMDERVKRSREGSSSGSGGHGSSGSGGGGRRSRSVSPQGSQRDLKQLRRFSPSHCLPPPAAGVGVDHLPLAIPPEFVTQPGLLLPPPPRQVEPTCCPYRNTSEEGTSIAQPELPEQPEQAEKKGPSSTTITPTPTPTPPPMDDNVQTLLVTVEKMLIVLHAADHALQTNPGAFPQPLATDSPKGGHFIFHPPPPSSTVNDRGDTTKDETTKSTARGTTEGTTKEYKTYWNDETFDPIQSAIRVYDRLGELGCPTSFLRLLIGLFPPSCAPSSAPGKDRTPEPLRAPLREEAPLAIHYAASSRSVPTSIVRTIVAACPDAVSVPCCHTSTTTLSSVGRSDGGGDGGGGHGRGRGRGCGRRSSSTRLPLHMALTAGRTWNDGVVPSILDASPSSLAVPDGPTGLYPFMIAAAACCCCCCSSTGHPPQEGGCSSSSGLNDVPPPVRMCLGEDKRMVPMVQPQPQRQRESSDDDYDGYAPSPPVYDEKEQQRRRQEQEQELARVDTAFRLLLECPTLVLGQGMTTRHA